MEKHYLQLPAGLCAEFITACNIRENRDSALYLATHVPGVQFLDTPPNSVDIRLKYDFADKTKLICKDGEITFLSPNADKFSRDICHLFYAAVRQELIKNGAYPVHAACVGDETGYRLLVGHSGTGKSTLAQHLVDHHGLKLFSGNKTVVEFGEGKTVHAIAGTRTMTVLDEQLQRKSYELDPDSYETAPRVDIKSIHLIRLNDGAQETAKFARSTSIRALYPFFMDSVNADIIVGEHHVFSGNTSSKSKHHLNRSLKRVLATIPTYRHAGSLEYLAKNTL